jgi:hypothetical protein
MDLKKMTVDELHTLNADVWAELNIRQGTLYYVLVYEMYRKCPSHGWLLDVRFAVEESSYIEWHPTEKAARDRLRALAIEENGIAPSDDVGLVDMTLDGCPPSTARIYPVSQYVETRCDW